VHNKEKITILDILTEVFPREITQFSPKRPDLNITIEQLSSDHDKDTKIERLYRELKEGTVMKAPQELSLPYSHISRKERKRYLIEYWLLNGTFHNDGN
jgi:hypothetical protein